VIRLRFIELNDTFSAHWQAGGIAVKPILAIAVTLAVITLARPTQAQDVSEMVGGSATTSKAASPIAKLRESSSALKLPDPMAIEAEAALMRRQGKDPLSNGMAIGALAGLAAGVIAAGVAGDCFESGGCDGRAIALGGAIGAGIGAAIGAGLDALMNRQPNLPEDGPPFPPGVRRWRPLGAVR
jgi:hypothetical protein